MEKLTNKYSTVQISRVVDTLKKHTGVDYKGEYEINKIIDSYVSHGVLNFPHNNNATFIEFKLPIVADLIFLNKKSLLLESLESYPDTAFYCFDMGAVYHKSLYVCTFHSPQENTAGLWAKKANKNNITFIIKSFGKRLIVCSNILSFIDLT